MIFSAFVPDPEAKMAIFLIMASAYYAQIILKIAIIAQIQEPAFLAMKNIILTILEIALYAHLQ